MRHKVGMTEKILTGVFYLFEVKTLPLCKISTKVLVFRIAFGPEFLFSEGLRTHYL